MAASLGFGAPAEIKRRTITLDEAQLHELREWILGCEVAWLTCAAAADALALETALQREYKPELTRP